MTYDYTEGRYDHLKHKALLASASLEKMKPVLYVLPDFLPVGKLTLLVGAPKDGKSTMLCAIAARITQGGSHGSWPDQTPTEIGNVVFISREDDFDDTIMPRLVAAGANLDFVKNVVGVTAFEPEPVTFDWSAEHIDHLFNAVKACGNVKAIFVDPVLQTVIGDANSNQKVQRAFERLAKLAKFLNCAIVGLAHVVKSAKGKDPLNRVAGPLAVGGVPRCIMVTAKIRNEESGIDGSHVLVRVTTLNKGDGGYSYAIEGCKVEGGNGPISTSRIVWKQYVEGTAIEIIGKAEGSVTTVKTADKLTKAIDFLKEILKNGPLTRPEIDKLTKEAQVSERYLLAAKTQLGVISKKQEGAGQFSPFEWRLPNAE